MSSKDSLTTPSLALMVLSWEHKVCDLLTASHDAQILMRVEAHCAWLQTCRRLSPGGGEHDAELCARFQRFPTAP